VIRVFQIEYPDDCGPLWMNKDNLLMCLTTETHTSNVRLKVTDITADKHDLSSSEGEGREKHA